MSRLLFDFACAAGHVTEHFVDSSAEAVRCPECARVARRQVSAPRAKLEPFTGAFPSAADKWARDRESHMARERHNQENHGTYK
jgi:hypothetical protein